MNCRDNGMKMPFYRYEVDGAIVYATTPKGCSNSPTLLSRFFLWLIRL